MGALMSQSEPLVYILLVNWNARQRTMACLASLRTVSYPNYKLVVIDNASSDGSPEEIVAACPGATLLRLHRNVGFAGANNEGFCRALAGGAEFVYLLNTDTHVAPDFLSRAIETATADVTIGIVGSKVLRGNRPDRLQFMGGRVNLATGYHGRPIGYNQVDQGQYDRVAQVAWVTGCAMMVSRACLEATGGFDDAFFAFQEDLDLCLRARTVGFRVVMSPRSRVWHEGGGSSGGAGSTTHMYYDVRNGLRLVQKHRPENVARSVFRSACIIGAHALQVASSRRSHAAVNAIVAGARDYYRGVTHVRPVD